MNYDQPLYRRSTASLLDRYTTRLLVGLLGSLGVMGLLLNLPLFYSSPQIGWTTQRPVDPIALQELQLEETSPKDQEAENHEPERAETLIDAPPSTRHTPPPSSPTGTNDASTDDSEPHKPSHRPDPSSSPQPIAALTTQDRHPQIKGGSGALYLQIRYPEAARRQRIEGRLELEFTVDRNGQVHAIEVAKSLHPLCDSAAVDALRSVEFRPAIYQGTPIPVRMKLPIRFQLRINDGGPLHTQRRPPSR